MEDRRPPVPVSDRRRDRRRSGSGTDSDPESFDGVVLKRTVAYILDAVAIGLMGTAIALVALVPVVLTLGMLWPVAVGFVALVPVAYHTLLIGGKRPATLGMRLFGVEVRTLTGAKPGYGVALLHTVTFYVTVGLTSWLILLVALFNRRRRTLHDFLCGTIVVDVASPEVRAASSQRDGGEAEAGPSSGTTRM